MKEISLSVVIPMFNEVANLKSGALDSVIKYLIESKFDYEIIIVDDGSTDESFDYVKKEYSQVKNLKCFSINHAGKSVALNRGVEKSEKDFILTTDMDQSTPINEVEKLVRFVQEYDVVIGSRGSHRSNTSILRKIASSTFTLLRRFFLLRDIEDTQCGFKLFESKILKENFPKLSSVLKSTETKGWKVTAYDVELLYLLRKKGAKIKEVRVEWSNRDNSTTKKRKFIRESIDMAKQVLTVRLNTFLGRYN